MSTSRSELSSSPPLPPQAPQTVALARQRRRLTALAEPPWLHSEVARRLAEKLDAILMEPVAWLDWSGRLGGAASGVVQRYPQAQRWVHEPDDLLAQRAAADWQAEQASQPKPWWARWKKGASGPAPILRRLDQFPEGWPQEGAGMLWANMSLHASADVDALAVQWHRVLRTDGFLMCSGLGPDTAKELRWVYDAMGWGLPTIRFIDMHDLGDALVKAGFADPVMDMERLTLTWPNAEAMLREWQSWGGNVAGGRFQGCRTPRWRLDLIQALESGLRRPDGLLGLTVELIYGHAVKPLPKVAMLPEARVSLEDMRKLVKARGH